MLEMALDSDAFFLFSALFQSVDQNPSYSAVRG
jgi:hypothetical protein